MTRSRPKSKQGVPESAAVTPAKAGERRRAPWITRRHWQFLLLSLVTVVAFAPALRGPLLFDDFLPIDENPSITTLSPLSVPLHPPKDQATAGRPVANITFAINYAINQAMGIDQRPDPDGAGKTFTYHLGNLLLHLLSGALLFGIFRRSIRADRFGERWAARADFIAFAVAGAWLLHPLSAAAVDYLMARTDVLVTCCYFAALYASIRAWDASTEITRNLWYAGAVFACALGMGSKEVMVSAPLMLLLYDRVFRLESWKSLSARALFGRRLMHGGLWASLLILVMLLAGSPRPGSIGFGLGMPWYTYLVSQGYGILHYLWLVIWPFGMVFDYGRYPFPLYLALPGFLVLGVIGAAVVWAWTRISRWGWLAFAGTWFFFLLAPTSSFVPLTAEIAADRRFYPVLPVVLLLILILALSFNDRRALRLGGVPVEDSPPHSMRRWGTLILFVLLALVTFRRSGLYADPEAIWRDTVAKAPGNARAYNNLATVLSGGSQRAEAEPLYRRAAELDSMYPDALMNLAQIELEHGNRAEAERLLVREVRAAPWNGAGLGLLSGLLLDHGDARGTVAILQYAADSVPDGGLLLNLGVAYAGLRRPVEAEAAFRRGLAKEPGRLDLLRSLGGLLTQQGRAAEALPLLEQAADAEPFSGLNEAMLAMAYAGMGRDSQAVASAGYAVKSPNADARVFVLAGRAMLGVKQTALAEQYLSKGLEGSAAGPDAYNALGKVREQLGMRAAAIDAYQRSLKVNPADSTARARLAALGRGH